MEHWLIDIIYLGLHTNLFKNDDPLLCAKHDRKGDYNYYYI